MSDPDSEISVPRRTDWRSAQRPPVEPIVIADDSSPVSAWARRVLGEINKVFIGQDRLVRGVLRGAPGRWARADRERAGAGQDAAGPGPGAGARLRRSTGSSSRPT